MQINLGTRGSKLALWQANYVQKKLENSGTKVLRKIIHTTGDLVQQKPLHQLGAIGIFTKALDMALIEGEVDIVVHSAKDMPSRLDENLEIFAFLKREDPRDVLLANSPNISLENLSQNIVVGTSSMRRRAFLKYYSPNVTVKDIRGNVDTRLEKLKTGDYDAIILAYAGVKRMGLESYIVQKLNTATFTPAVGQGVVAVVGRKDSPLKAHIHQILNDALSEYALLAERSFLHTVAGGCSIPVFGFATVVREKISLLAGIADEATGEIYRSFKEGNVSKAVDLGKSVGEVILEKSQRRIDA